MSSMDPRPSRARLVGRARERQVFRWALDELAAGRGVTIELTGDPGIGKTRLLLELAEQARRRGVAVCKGSATEFERDRPFQVFADALADRYRRSGAAGTHPQWLAAVFSGQQVPGSGAERFRLFDAVRDLLADWADGGLALLLDDMHWADPAAAELADYLVRRPPDGRLLLVLAHRGRQSQARLAGTLARGAELGTVTRIEVGPLSAAEAAELAGDDLDDAARQALYTESDGNPLYLLAAVSAAARHGGTHDHESGGASAPDWVPSRLEAVLLAELTPLTAQESAVAAAGAVAGEQFTIDALTAITGLRPAEVTSAISVLTRRDVLRAGAAGTFGFRHPVLRRVVYQDSDPAWRTGAHRRALADLRRRGAPPAELAHHVAASPDGGEPADTEILLAAARAVMSTAPATAAHWLRACLRLLPADGRHAQRRLEVLLLLTRALGVAGRLAESRDLLHEILRVVPMRPPGPRVAAVTFCATMERLLAHYPEARALLTAELASPRAAATPEGIPLAIEYATVALLSGDFPAAREELTAAAARARRGASRIRQAYAEAISAFGEVYEGNIGQSATVADAAAAIVDTLPDGELSEAPECLAVLGWAELFLDRRQDAARHFARGVSITRNSGQYHVLPHLLLGQCQLAAFHGPLGQAIALSQDAEEIARTIDSGDVLGLALGLRALALAWTGGEGPGKQAVDLAEQAAASIPPGSVWWTRTVAIFHGIALLLSGNPAGCITAMTAAGGGDMLPLTQPSVRPAALEVLTAAAVLAGDNDKARQWSAYADAESRRIGLDSQRGYAARGRGFVLAAAGRHREAVAAYQTAADMFGRTGGKVAHAWALAMGADSALADGRADTALAMAAEAASLARATGSVTILGTAEGVRQRLTPGPDAAADPLALLTVREREIARLAASGRTSRDIADQLHLSPRTVDTHLSRVYHKLGLSSRAALASLLASPRT